LKEPFPIAASIAQRPGFGGHAWAFLHYALGLRMLGYEPIFIDRLSDEMATDGAGGPSPEARRRAIEWFRDAMEFAGLAGSSSLLLDGGETIGLPREELEAAIARAPALINVMGFLTDAELLGAAETVVFLDVDPGFTQLWQELYDVDLLAGHDRFASVGANLGSPRCRIPTLGREWIPIRPPVALDLWPATASSARSFRSVGSWRGPYAPIEHEGRTLGLRVHEFRRFAELPRRVAAEFEVALEIDAADGADAELMRANGWRLLEPREVAGSLELYRGFVGGSGAEIAIAKSIYVETGSGWFSDRSACFLASGRPVLAQDTGFASSLPTGEGLLRFETVEEAADGAERILGEWPRHSRAARELAAEVFDARKVMGGLLGRLGVA
jgi:hypothetical protein